MNGIKYAQDQLNWLFNNYCLNATENCTGGDTDTNTPCAIQDILTIAYQSELGDKIRALIDGDISGHDDDHSKADYALCHHLAYYTSKDKELIDRIFRQSKLYRSKWDEIHSGDGRTYGQMTIDKAIADTKNVYKESFNSTGVVGWPQPKPLITRTQSQPYPIDALPDIVRNAVNEVLDYVQAPIAMIVSSAIAALSLAIQAFVNVARDDKLIGPVSLFLGVIAESGERKTTCDNVFTGPIRDFVKQKEIELGAKIKETEAYIKAWKAEFDGLEMAIKSASKKGNPTDDLCIKTAKLQSREPKPIKVPKLLLNDATPEALAFSLAHDWPSSGLISSEGASVLGSHGMGKDSIMRNLGLMNTLWDGGEFNIDRKTSQSYVLRDARLTVSLQVQESALRAFFDRDEGLSRGMGFLARFLISWPESTQGTRLYKEPPQEMSALRTFNDRIVEILNVDYPMDEEGRLRPTILTLSPEAKKTWVQFYNYVESRLKPNGELSTVRDVASKIADNAVRLAALFRVFNGTGVVVGESDIRSAGRIVEWHLSESRRLFDELALPVELANATKLDTWLIGYCKRENVNSIGRRKAQQLGPVRNKDALNEALEVLKELSRAQLVIHSNKKIIYINPKLLSGN